MARALRRRAVRLGRSCSASSAENGSDLPQIHEKGVARSYDPTRWGQADVLFDAQDFAYGTGARGFDIAPDGQRFMMIKRGGEDAAPPQINVVLNWFQELTERVPVP